MPDGWGEMARGTNVPRVPQHGERPSSALTQASGQRAASVSESAEESARGSETSAVAQSAIGAGPVVAVHGLVMTARADTRRYGWISRRIRSHVPVTSTKQYRARSPRAGTGACVQRPRYALGAQRGSSSARATEKRCEERAVGGEMSGLATREATGAGLPRSVARIRGRHRCVRSRAGARRPAPAADWRR